MNNYKKGRLQTSLLIGIFEKKKKGKTQSLLLRDLQWHSSYTYIRDHKQIIYIHEIKGLQDLQSQS